MGIIGIPKLRGMRGIGYKARRLRRKGISPRALAAARRNIFKAQLMRVGRRKNR